jgi:hypothetical protein
LASSVSCANSSAAAGLDERTADLLGHDLVVIFLDLHALCRRLQIVLGQILGEIVGDARRAAFGSGMNALRRRFGDATHGTAADRRGRTAVGRSMVALLPRLATHLLPPPVLKLSDGAAI